MKNNKLPNNYRFVPLKGPLTIKNSPIEGLGLFATSRIPINTNLGPSHFKIECTEFTVHEDEFLEEYHPDGIMRLSLGGYINHQEDDNVKMVDKGCYYVFITTKEILGGDELFINYHNTPVIQINVNK